MGRLPLRTKFEPIAPGWLDLGKSRDVRAAGHSLTNLVNYLATTSRLPVYTQDQFVEKKPLGSGRSFSATVCRDIESGDLVVVKHLRIGESADNFDDAVILQELKIAVYPPLRNHANVIQILGFIADENVSNGTLAASLVLEHASGGSLAQYLSNVSTPVSQRDWHQRERIILDVCTGLETLHRCRILHGDIKPENILLVPINAFSSAQDYVAKLADFGSSIVEDTIDFDATTRVGTHIYKGTPIFVPGYLRKFSGRVPFHTMPAVEMYSFGLLLWSVCMGEEFYAREQNLGAEDILQYLDNLGSSGLQQKFRADLAELEQSPLDIRVSKLWEAFTLCVKDVVVDFSPLLPSSRERTYREAFSAITRVQETLSFENEESSDSKDYKHRTPVWQPFHLGDLPSIEDFGDLVWSLQCELFKQCLERLEGPYEPKDEKAKAALHLSSHFAVGLGCQQDYNKVLHYLRLSASWGNTSAQLICGRIWQAHGSHISREHLDIDPPPDKTIEIAISEDSELDEDSLNSGEEFEHHVYDAPSPHANDEFTDSRVTSGDEMEFGSDSEADSEADSKHVVFNLSTALDAELQKWNMYVPEDYFWNKIRMFRQAMAYASQGAMFKYEGILYEGLADPTMMSVIEDISTNQQEISEVEWRCDDGTFVRTPILHHAISCGMFGLVKNLTPQRVPVNEVNDDGDTALHLAMRCGFSEIVEYLVKHGANVSVANNDGVTPLHYLCMFGDDTGEMVGEEQASASERLDGTRAVNFTGLDVSSIAELLVHAGAEVNASMGEFSSVVDVFFSHRISGTPLHAATATGNRAAVCALLRLGADPNARSSRNSLTPTETAAQLHLAEILRAMLKHGASLRPSTHQENSQGSWTMHYVGHHVRPLTRWLLHGQNYQGAVRDTINVLIEAAKEEKLSLDVRNDAGFTAFECALSEEGEDAYIVKAFLECYATLPNNALVTAVLSCSNNEANSSKVDLVLRTSTLYPTAYDQLLQALNEAVSTGAIAAARSIIDFASPNSLLKSQDEDGLTPLHHAASSGNLSATEYLLSLGAPIDVQDTNGHSPLGQAILRGSEVLTMALLSKDDDAKTIADGSNGRTILHLGVSKNARQPRSMLTYLLSADREEAEADELRFPQLHLPDILNAIDATNGDSALHTAAYYGDFAGVFALINAGANVLARNLDNLSPHQVVRERLRDLRSNSTPNESRYLLACLEKCDQFLGHHST